MGKGDARRPGDDKAFAENFDKIFKKPSKPTEVEEPKEVEKNDESPDRQRHAAL